MPSWKLKAAAQGVISLLPGSYALNQVLQKHVTKSLDLTPGEFDLKLGECRRHIENYLATASGRQWGLSGRPFRVLEIGTGCYPIIPVGLYLCGASSLCTLDRAPLATGPRVASTLRAYLERHRRGELVRALPWVREDRLAHLEAALSGSQSGSPDQILGELRIRTMILGSGPSRLNLPPVDFIFSNTTLEYVPAAKLPGLFAELKRACAPGAVMSHFIVLGDHCADFDKSITPFNFLKYSPSVWRFYNNSLNYQNRLRLSDYRRLHQSAGFRVLAEQHDEGRRSDLDGLRLAKEFRSYPREELLVIRAWMVSESVPAAEGDCLETAAAGEGAVWA